MRQRFESLQALRGVACLLVVVYHIAGAEVGYGLGFNPCKPTLWFGYAGVDLFFVLSGFIIASTCLRELGQPSRLPQYLFRRVWRIYPTYWAALIPSVAIYAALSPQPLLAPGWPAELADTLLLLPQSDVPRMLPVAWTLSYELMFYFAFALLFILPRRAAIPALAAWGIAVIGIAIDGHIPGNMFARLAVSPFILEFLAGCLLATQPIRFTTKQSIAVASIALGWCVVGSFLAFDRDAAKLPMNHILRVLVFGVAAALMVLSFTAWERGGGQVRRRWLSTIGDASYSIYLVHIPFLVLATYFTLLAGMSHSRTMHYVWIAIMLVVTVGSGLLLYRFVEYPLIQLGKRMLSKRSDEVVKSPSRIPERIAA